MRLNPLAVWASLFLALAFLTPRVTAQTTQPATTSTTASASPTSSTESASEPEAEQGPSWQQTIDRLAEQLSGQDLNALRRTLDRDAGVRRFSSDAASTAERLLAATTQAKLLGAHGYPRVPQTLAGDLANDFQKAGDLVPQQVRDDMTPPDAAAQRRANDTAAAWVTQVLQPKKDQVVGVIVFWPTDRRLPTDTTARRAIFVLVKGQLRNGSYVMQQLTFGDPLETPR
jgi:hypothetical protein